MKIPTYIPKSSLLALVALGLATGVSQAAITVLATGSAVTAANSGPGQFTLSSQGPGNRDGIYSFSFAAGATSDMLVVSVSVEASAEAWTVSYGGVDMFLATQSSVGSGTSIFYLPNPSATGSIAIDYTGKATVNGIGLGIASLHGNGEEIAFDDGVSTSGVASIGITTNFDNSFVMFAGDANSTTAPASTLGSSLTSIYSGISDIGSNTAAAGYENGVAAGLNTYSWTPAAEPRGISAAAFYTIPEPGAALLGSLGLLALLRRRRS